MQVNHTSDDRSPRKVANPLAMLAKKQKGGLKTALYILKPEA
jgi:hypothetical protein